MIARDHQRNIGKMHTKLYTQCFTGQALTICTRCKKPGHTATSCIQRLGMCTFYNHVHLHRCTFCQGSHKAVECPTRSSTRPMSAPLAVPPDSVSPNTMHVPVAVNCLPMSILTPVNVASLETKLSCHPDCMLVGTTLPDLQEGCHLGFMGNRSKAVLSNNFNFCIC